MNGKGSKQRPLSVDRKVFEKNWDSIFGKKYESEFKLGERVCGSVLFGNGLRLEGIVVKEDAGISRDAIIVEVNDGADTAVMLSHTVERVNE